MLLTIKSFLTSALNVLRFRNKNSFPQKHKVEATLMRCEEKVDSLKDESKLMDDYVEEVLEIYRDIS